MVNEEHFLHSSFKKKEFAEPNKQSNNQRNLF